MKFKTLVAKSGSSAPVTCIGWSSTEEVYSAGDDNQLLCWSVSNTHPTKVAQLPKDLYPLELHFLPKIGGGGGGGGGKLGDLILITSADGKFHIMNRSGRIERSVEAHKGAVLVGQWGNDGAGLLTAGEDGCVKIWSRSGMLRSTVVSSDSSVYGASWAPDTQSIAYTQGKFVVIKQLAPNTKPIKWKAHEGLVLCLAWSPACDLIVSGGEDCRYKVWDTQGRQVFSSGLHDNHIVSVSWAPSGDVFAVGSYNTLRLCDQSGWSQYLEKPSTGCIYKTAWSSDGTQLAGACATGQVLFAHVVERHVHYRNFVATVTERKVVSVRDVSNDIVENLELPERVIQMALRYSHLVVTTPSQCYIYNTSNWNTPAIFDLKDGCVILLLLAEKHLLMVEKSILGLYNYQGRLIASPRWPNMRLDSLRTSQIALSPDTLAVRDFTDSKAVHVVDLSITRNAPESTTSITHSLSITQISLDQWGPSATRNMVLLDKIGDLYITQVRNPNRTFNKIGRKIESFQWNTEENILAGIQDAQLIVWYCPTAAFNAALLKSCSFYYDSPELGRNPRISDFVGNSVSIRRADGSLINVPISPFPAMLHKCIQDNNWTDALKLCRMTNNQTLWACLAVLATQAGSDVIDLAEEAYSNIGHYDKVFFIQNIKKLVSKPQQKAGMALLGGAFQEADSILLHNGMVFQAVYNNCQLYKWDRALELAQKHKAHIETVLYLRQQYLDDLKKIETNAKFVTARENVQIDGEKMKEKLQSEIDRIKMI